MDGMGCGRALPHERSGSRRNRGDQMALPAARRHIDRIIGKRMCRLLIFCRLKLWRAPGGASEEPDEPMEGYRVNPVHVVHARDPVRRSQSGSWEQQANQDQ